MKCSFIEGLFLFFPSHYLCNSSLEVLIPQALREKCAFVTEVGNLDFWSKSIVETDPLNWSQVIFLTEFYRPMSFIYLVILIVVSPEVHIATLLGGVFFFCFLFFFPWSIFFFVVCHKV